jgi:hypothetical protein
VVDFAGFAPVLKALKGYLMSGANLKKRKETMSTRPVLAPDAQTSSNPTFPAPPSSTSVPNPGQRELTDSDISQIPFLLKAGRYGFLGVFVAIAVLTVKTELTPWLLILALVSGLASIFFWAKLPAAKLPS